MRSFCKPRIDAVEIARATIFRHVVLSVIFCVLQLLHWNDKIECVIMAFSHDIGVPVNVYDYFSSFSKRQMSNATRRSDLSRVTAQ
jgi:hypothetical protein